MSAFRTRYTEVEAQRFLPLDQFSCWKDFCEAANALARWCNGLLRLPLEDAPYIIVQTLHGQAKIAAGEWVVREARGFRPCSAAEFEETYEAITQPKEELAA